MISIIKKRINRLLGFVGLGLHFSSNTPQRRLYKALAHFHIDTVLDVGANVGQFASELRQGGFKGRIVSFEPLSEAYAILCKKAKNDSGWLIHSRGALGNQDGETTINVAGNSVSSSILDMNKSHSSAAQESAYTGSETINIQKIDSIADQYLSNNKTFLKIDTQGFESQILDGAVNTLPDIQGILLETSLIELYKGEVLWQDMINRLEKDGFTIWSIERGFTDSQNGRTLQCDVVFFKI